MIQGLQLNFQKGKNYYGLSYSVSGIPIVDSKPDIVQAFSLNLYFAYYSDRTPPSVSAKEEYGIIAPASFSNTQFTYFKLFAEDRDSDIKKWYFVICTTNQMGEPGDIKRAFSGKGLPPKTSKWDGRDSYKNLLEPGYYSYQLVVADGAGNVAETRWQIIEVRE